MPCSDARLAANRANALKSTGPITTEGKQASRRNSLKHGLTGQGVVVPGEDATEIAARFDQFAAELAHDGSATTRLLAERLAVLSVRIERSVRQDFAATADRVRRAGDAWDQAHTIDPNGQGTDPAAMTAMRATAVGLAMVGDDPTTLLHRKYEAAIERSIFQTLREIRAVGQARPAPALDENTRSLVESLARDRVEVDRTAVVGPPLGSFLPGPAPSSLPAHEARISIGKPARKGQSAYLDRSKRPRLHP